MLKRLPEFSQALFDCPVSNPTRWVGLIAPRLVPHLGVVFTWGTPEIGGFCSFL